MMVTTTTTTMIMMMIMIYKSRISKGIFSTLRRQ